MDPRLAITEWVGVAGFVWVAGVDAGFVGAAREQAQVRGALWLLVCGRSAVCAVQRSEEAGCRGGHETTAGEGQHT